MIENFKKVCDYQKIWTSKNTDAMRERGILIRTIIPNILRQELPRLQKIVELNEGDLDIEGSDGTGLKTRVPWVRVHSSIRSPSAINGWYLVFLFHSQGKGFYLSLCHGGNTWKYGSLFSRPIEELNRLVDWARGLLKSELSQKFEVIEKIKLGTKGGSRDLAESYENGTAFAIWYPLENLPDNIKLVEDLLFFSKFLRKIYNEYDLGRTPFSADVEEDQIVSAIGAISSPTKSSSFGQGYGLTIEERKAVEIHAMNTAFAYFKDGWDVIQDVSSKKSYDIHLKKNSLEARVEVKGTTGPLGSIILTQNEVMLHTDAKNSILFVVHDMDLKRKGKRPKASGGKITLLNPWKLDRNTLSPIAYRYPVVPAS